jgi:glutamate--cysteine ligase catalytic subunit
MLPGALWLLFCATFRLSATFVVVSIFFKQRLKDRFANFSQEHSMGLLILGEPLDWEESKQHHEYVKQRGVEQFLQLYNRYAGMKNAAFKWGDEVEYLICSMDEKTKTARLSLRAPEILKKLEEAESAAWVGKDEKKDKIVWHPEYANWMLEATPGHPYSDSLNDLLEVEANMVARRRHIQAFLNPGEELFSLTTFPRLGTPNFTVPSIEIDSSRNEVSKSIYIPDEAINPHPRFPTLTANIRKRRGEKVDIAVPVFQDRGTHETLRLQSEHAAAMGAPLSASFPADSIHMDAMAFGMGSSCLQVTMQAADIHEARLLYDQLAVVAPLFLALTAGSPIWKGMLADTDVRWDIIAASVDDRDAVERGLAPPAAGRGPIAKSRYSSIDTYIAAAGPLRDEYNDIPCAVDGAAHARLLAAGVDPRLARHVARLFVRDPLVVFADRVGPAAAAAAAAGEGEGGVADHFESLQSTNWNTVRFKPPPADPAAGIQWRVEFRSMELALTDFENAAHAAAVVLLARAIAALGLDLYLPLSKGDDNMARAHRRGAAATGRFWARRDARGGAAAPDVAEMSLGEVFNGDGAGYPGLLGFCREYLDRTSGPADPARARIEAYLALVGRRAAGEIPTTAAWMRAAALAHPAYAGDSAVPEAVCHDLLAACRAAASGGSAAAGLLGAAAAAAAAVDSEKDKVAGVSGGTAAAAAAACGHPLCGRLAARAGSCMVRAGLVSPAISV